MPQHVYRAGVAEPVARPDHPRLRPARRHDHRLFRRRLRLVPALRRPLRRDPMLETINLTKRYEDGELALDGLTLKVEPGEIFCMFGANGAGKTTTINLLLGFIPPTSGTALDRGHRRGQGPAQGQAPRLLRLRERHALRQLHGHPEPRLLQQAGRQAEPDQEGLRRGPRPGRPPEGGLRPPGQELLQGHAPEARHRHRRGQGRRQRPARRADLGPRPPVGPRVPGDPGPDARPGEVGLHVDPRHLPGQAHRRPDRIHAQGPAGHDEDGQGAGPRGPDRPLHPVHGEEPAGLPCRRARRPWSERGPASRPDRRGHGGPSTA
ncbi:MAG: ATP-binding cassette domain-containing protein [Rhodopseudomonas palustris]|nr:ATP-binding cassette domain-containing protein [Rhodopseudomonas palustris]